LIRLFFFVSYFLDGSVFTEEKEGCFFPRKKRGAFSRGKRGVLFPEEKEGCFFPRGNLFAYIG
jgi:hypothetical protein